MATRDPMIRGTEALFALQEMARTPNHNRMITGEKADDILAMVELYRMALGQNQITEQMLLTVRQALALHASMAAGGELPSVESKRMLEDAMKIMDRVKSGPEIAPCEKCGKYHERGSMKVMGSLQKAMRGRKEDWKLSCLNCWQAYLQSEVGILRVHALRVVNDAAKSSSSLEGVHAAIKTMADFLDDGKRRRATEEMPLHIAHGGRITGELPCGHAVTNIVVDRDAGGPYCAACWNS